MNTKGQADFEESLISNGYLPLILIYTHHQSGCQKTCIDNIISNQPVGNILASGTIAGQTSKHVGIFQISDLNSSEIIKSTDKKIKIEYDYNNENLQSFVTILSQNLEEPESVSSESFEKFSEIFKLSIDQSCKLDIPKTTKINFVDNPWMNAGITKSICINDKLYENWISSFKTIDIGDNKLKEKQKNHQRWLIKKLKSQHYAKKFENSQGDKKKTWKIINELRGKQKTNVKASFVIGNERIICRRIIAENSTIILYH